MKSRIGTWESIWKDQICKQWSGADGMIRLGGQIDLRKFASRLNTLLEVTIMILNCCMHIN